MSILKKIWEYLTIDGVFHDNNEFLLILLDVRPNIWLSKYLCKKLFTFVRHTN